MTMPMRISTSFFLMFLMMVFSLSASWAQTPDMKPQALKDGVKVASPALPSVAAVEKDAEAEEGDFDLLRDPFESFLPKKKKVEDIVSLPPPTSKTDESREEGEEEGGEPFDYESLKISGLIWGGASPKVIINDEIYGIGDVVNEAKIVNISKEGILFEHQDKNYLLKR